MRRSGVGGQDNQQSSRRRPRQRGSGRAQGEGRHRAPQGQGGPNRGRAMMEAARARPRGERAPRAPGPGGDVAPVAVRHRRGVLVFKVRVPFQSPLEACLARRSLLRDVQRHQGITQKEFVVNGNDLIVRWTAEDLAFIRIPINLFLDQLSQVIQNIRSLGIPPFLG
ncbi:EKC/KEOPS complex subunit LAGE3-like [Odocoileus virginianus]|uniref:EKC/KEOPS complex subunit LAGE3-like n=1 Tax=Odocoileus virginianus TaxID=9874 RepID=A0ABM4ILM0_ODOVR